MGRHLRAFSVVASVAIVLSLAGIFFKGRFFGLGNLEPQANASIAVGQLVPQFEGVTISDRPLALRQMKGKIVIVNFWASWCNPCVEEMPSLIKLVKDFPNDIELVAVSGDSNLEDVNSFIKSFPEMKSVANIHVIFDQSKSLSQLYRVFRLPESFIIDRDLRLAKKISGTINWYTEDAIAYIRKM